jgi:hypothetical protein
MSVEDVETGVETAVETAVEAAVETAVGTANLGNGFDTDDTLWHVATL